jgi:hypothetical protein
VLSGDYSSNSEVILSLGGDVHGGGGDVHGLSLFLIGIRIQHGRREGGAAAPPPRPSNLH